jgi:hypothetical protein
MVVVPPAFVRGVLIKGKSELLGRAETRSRQPKKMGIALIQLAGGGV